MMQSPCSVSAAPWSGAERPTAPPRWRSSTLSSGEPESGPAAATSASIVSAVTVSTMPPSPLPGTGPGGSMCSVISSAVGIVWIVSISGPSSRSGATIASRRAGSLTSPE